MNRVGARAAGLLAALLLALLGAWVSPAAASACDCAGISPLRALRQADVVFRGVVTATDDVGRGADARTDVRFRVDTVWKGTAFADQVVATPQDPAGCGLGLGARLDLGGVRPVQGSRAGATTPSPGSSPPCAAGTSPPGRRRPRLGPGQIPRPGSSDRAERATRTDRHAEPLAAGGRDRGRRAARRRAGPGSSSSGAPAGRAW